MSRALRRARGGLLALLVAGYPLHAQRAKAPDVDVGAGIVRFPEDDRWIAGPWLRASMRDDAAPRRWRAAATVIASPSATSGLAEAAASRQGELGWRGLAWDGGGEATALFGTVSRPSESVLASAHLLAPIADGGVRMGGGTHAAHRESGLLRGASVEAGAWWRLSRATILASLMRQWAEGQLFAGGSRAFPLGVVPVRYVEGSASVIARPSWGTLDATVGVRRDPDADQRMEPLWSVGALVRTSEAVGITLNVARQPADYVRGADAMESVSIGLRLASRPGRTPPSPSGGAVVELVSQDSGPARTLRFRVPGAHAVAVMGDFTDWEPVALVSRSGDFLLASPLSPGLHRLLVRLDGGAWMVPANTPAVDDDLGGRVGLMVVP